MKLESSRYLPSVLRLAIIALASSTLGLVEPSSSRSLEKVDSILAPSLDDSDCWALAFQCLVNKLTATLKTKLELDLSLPHSSIQIVVGSQVLEIDEG